MKDVTYILWLDPGRKKSLDALLDRLGIVFLSTWLSDNPTATGADRTQQYSYTIRCNNQQMDEVDKRLEGDCVCVAEKYQKEAPDE